ncbi:hypothetical protein EN943_20175 [Mesorhizobium sp. M7A.F.Ca.US.006.01.1.1]|uniref:hypothetical protein n=1 Tax=Mesorhizobium sp. M7A.F.Ca.US.006.01.1.1 TaxID=2496707 RepID=UPI000FC9FE2A|nr:hypothetical protein [Mesorhizobium sp. M7A.F.Ca.US.006.01.1.1]RUZ75625.1 hypothetical protein EN943_20175 [Mesorhizobium sp. M7A.F.Ca.US.006.01.1.1]
MFDQGQFYPGQPIQFMEGLLNPIIGVNQYMTFFSEYTVGTQPSDWTSKYGTGFTALVQTVPGSLGGKALRWTKTAAARQGLSWDRIPSTADVEVLMRVRAIEAYAVSDNFLAIYMRGSGSTGTETGWRGSISGIATTTLAISNLHKYVSGAATVVGVGGDDIPSPNYAVNDWLWHRARVNGSTITRKTWHDGAAEPGAWDDTVSDAAIPGAGWVGLQQVTANPNSECDFFSVGLNGEVAPSP